MADYIYELKHSKDIDTKTSSKLHMKLDKNRYNQMRSVYPSKLVKEPENYLNDYYYFICSNDTNTYSIMKTYPLYTVDKTLADTAYIDAFYENKVINSRNQTLAQNAYSRYASIYTMYFQIMKEKRICNQIWTELPVKTALSHYSNQTTSKHHIDPVIYKYHRKIFIAENSRTMKNTIRIEKVNQIDTDHYENYYKTIMYYNASINSHGEPVSTILKKLYPPFPTLKDEYLKIYDDNLHIGYLKCTPVWWNSIRTLAIDIFIPNLLLPLSSINVANMTTILRKIASMYSTMDICYTFIAPHKSVSSSYQNNKLLKWIKACCFNLKVIGGCIHHG